MALFSGSPDGPILDLFRVFGGQKRRFLGIFRAAGEQNGHFLGLEKRVIFGSFFGPFLAFLCFSRKDTLTEPDILSRFAVKKGQKSQKSKKRG